MVDIIRLNPSETSLKGGNRGLFERRLAENIRAKLASFSGWKLGREQGSFILGFDRLLDVPEVEAVAGRLATVFGIGRIVLARRCPPDMKTIIGLAVEMSRGLAGTFKIEADRSDKKFPLTSPGICREAGAAVLASVPGLKVDVHHPETVVEIQVGNNSASVSVRSVDGPGGLPLGSSGKLVALLSGGIDSPVAAWSLMRRGCSVAYAHCHSYPYTSRESLDKIRRLTEALGRWQPDADLYLIPFGDAQKEIVARAAPRFRVILYRRLMLRLAAEAAREEKALGLITGDSVGQVASQTLENLAAVSAAVGLPVYRPLIGENKDDIVRRARLIGTYDISIEPHDDCCSLFVPPRPETKARLADVEREEAKYDAAALVRDAWDKAEKLEVRSGIIR